MQNIILFFFYQEETLYMDRESQIKAIEKTFEDNKKPIERHYSKPNVVPLEILPVYPDFKVTQLQQLLQCQFYQFFFHYIICFNV